MAYVGGKPTLSLGSVRPTDFEVYPTLPAMASKTMLSAPLLVNSTKVLIGPLSEFGDQLDRAVARLCDPLQTPFDRQLLKDGPHHAESRNGGSCA